MVMFSFNPIKYVSVGGQCAGDRRSVDLLTVVSEGCGVAEGCDEEADGVCQHEHCGDA